MKHKVVFPNPPPWMERYLSKWIDPDLHEGILGDMYEKYLMTHDRRGVFRANLQYLFNALGYLRYARLSRQNSNSNWNNMYKNHLTITLRTLKKHKVYSAINIIGLAIGMAAGFMILQYVHYEFEYDSFFENKENIYRVKQNRYNKGELTTVWASGCAGVGPAMKSEIPEVRKYVKLTSSNTMLSYRERYIKVEDAYYATEDFFEVFSVPLISGVDSAVLKKPYSAVLSRSLATKIFGDKDPLGQEVNLNGNWDFMITGVFEDLPENTHMAIDILYSFETYVAIIGEEVRTQWNWDGFMTYVELAPGTDPSSLDDKMKALTEKYNGEELRRYDSDQSFEFQRLNEIHLTSDLMGEFKPNGNRQTTYFLLIVGIFVLIIAWINYINLSTARSMQRAKEVGVRKVVGSSKTQLIHQFMFESAFTNLISIVLAALLVLWSYPYFSHFVGRTSLYAFPQDPDFWAPFILMIISGTIISGIYPALILSRYRPIKVLSGKFETSSSGSLLRKVLVIFQFVISVMLITGTFVIYNQLQFLQDQDLGVTIDQTMVIRTPIINADSVYEGKSEVFRNNLLNEAQVVKFTVANSVPGRRARWNAGGIRLLHQNESEANQYRVIAMDDQFLDLFGVELIEGRGFDASFGSEESSVVVNEAAVSMLGAVDPSELINQKMFFWGDTFNIVGVVKNFRQESPKSAYDPMVFRYFKVPSGYYALKISTSDMHALIDKIQANWTDMYGGQPMDFFFLDDYYNEQYKTESRFGTIFAGFAGLAIFVACMGLFGLASFTTSLRTKEVSVRKVLGANFQQLFMLLTKDFIKLVVIAVIISIPVSWWLLSQWLLEFANRIDLNWYLFSVPAFGLLIISLLTIGYHTYRTAVINPSRTLKYE